MTIAETLLPEFDQEMASTRKLLARVPGDKGTWKPHQKSFPSATWPSSSRQCPDG